MGSATAMIRRCRPARVRRPASVRRLIRRLADAGAASPGLRWHDGSLTAPEWAHAVAVAVSRISAGALRKVVLARDVFATAAGPIDARVLLRRLAARYPDCFTFACANLVGATPELLVRRQGSEVTALILGGTSPRGAQPAEDAALGADLLASAKNTEEHAYAVASVRDALAPLCAELDIPSRPSLLKLANVHHLGTSVRGTLSPGPFGAIAGRSAAPTRGGVRDTGRNGAGTDPRAGAHGTGPVRRAGRLGGRARQRRVRDRPALRRTGRPPGPAVRRLRHRGGLGPGRRGGRDRGQVPPDAPVPRRLSVPGHPVSPACRGATVPARGHALAPGPGPGVSAASGGWPGRLRPRPGAGRRGPGCRPGRSRSC